MNNYKGDIIEESLENKEVLKKYILSQQELKKLRTNIKRRGFCNGLCIPLK